MWRIPAESGDGGGSGGSNNGKGGESDLDELIRSAKNAMSKGTSLWKAGKRNDCGDLYLEVTQHIIDSVFASDLKKPLEESKREADKADKSKAAVMLRKAMDKFITDAKTPAMKKADADAAEGGGGGSGSATESPIVKQLQEELSSLKDKLDIIDVEKEKAGEAQRSPRFTFSLSA